MTSFKPLGLIRASVICWEWLHIARCPGLDNLGRGRVMGRQEWGSPRSVGQQRSAMGLTLHWPEVSEAVSATAGPAHSGAQGEVGGAAPSASALPALAPYSPPLSRSFPSSSSILSTHHLHVDVLTRPAALSG